MGMTTAPVSLSRYHARVETALNKTLDQLGSGKRVRKAADNPTRSAVLKQLEAQERSATAAQKNTNDAKYISSTIEGTLNQQQQLLTRMRGLSMQAANGTLTEEQRRIVQNEFEGLRTGLDQLANNTKVGGASLFSGGHFDIQVGTSAGPDSQIELEVPETSASFLGLGTAEVGTSFGATNAIEMIDRAIDQINKNRAAIGATHNRMDSADQHLSRSLDNQRATQSQIGDTDFAQANSTLSRQQFLMRANIKAMQVQKEQRGQLLNLLA